MGTLLIETSDFIPSTFLRLASNSYSFQSAHSNFKSELIQENVYSPTEASIEKMVQHCSPFKEDHAVLPGATVDSQPDSWMFKDILEDC